MSGDSSVHIVLPDGAGELIIRLTDNGPADDDFIDVMSELTDQIRKLVHADVPKLIEALSGAEVFGAGLTVTTHEQSVSYGGISISYSAEALMTQNYRDGSLLGLLDSLLINDVTGLAAQALAQYHAMLDFRPFPLEAFDSLDDEELVKTAEDRL